MSIKAITVALTALTVMAPPSGARAADTFGAAQAAIDKGLAYLATQQQADGSWQTTDTHDYPAITAMAAKAFVRDGHDTSKSPVAARGYAALFAFQQPDGGIYTMQLDNYNSAISASSIAAANDPEFKDRLDHVIAYLKGIQWTGTARGPKGESANDPDKKNWEGGWGYGRHGRPDLSNVQFTLDALHDAGVQSDDPAYKAALAFVTRCQNNRETSDQPFAGNNGGFFYTCAGGGDSEAESYTGPDGAKHWRSYGSMTYAGLKSLMYCGLKKDDPRVVAALGWIQHNWTLDQNPGLAEHDPKQAADGLFYYFHAMSRCLNALDQPIITDSAGKTHDWRAELTTQLANEQQPDGSWDGTRRWLESNRTLATAYSVLSLEEVQADLREHHAN